MCFKETTVSTRVMHLTARTAWQWIEDEFFLPGINVSSIQVRLYFVPFAGPCLLGNNPSNVALQKIKSNLNA